ncbi:MAG: phenylpyruvate tautomerase MIF-related protein [Bacillota bacterium]
MPYISSVTSVQITEIQKESLKSKLAQAMQKTAGKGENWLMLSFRCGESMYFQGKKGDKTAYLEVKVVGTLSSAQKNELAAEIGGIYQEELGIPADKTYIVFFEVSGANWGWNGGTFGS